MAEPERDRALSDLVDTLTRGNPTEVKVVLASVALALAGYQLAMIALLLLCTGVMCLSVYGFEGAHAAFGSALLAVLACKIAAVRRDFGLGRFLPVLGITVFLMLCVTSSS